MDLLVIERLVAHDGVRDSSLGLELRVVESVLRIEGPQRPLPTVLGVSVGMR